LEIQHNPKYRAALHVARHLAVLGHQAYFAGGCVRDLLLGREPEDYDVATSATPQMVQTAFTRTESVGAHFGVVLVIDKENKQNESKKEAEQNENKNNDDGSRIVTEVATFRSDGAYSDGRRPDAVRFSTDPREDAVRRDFSINGMLLDVLRYERGDRLVDCVLDYVGGVSDLDAGIVRAIGDPHVRFAEDKLRMLRAVRFAARLNFAIAPRTMAAIREQAAEIHAVSAERVRDELTRILTEGAARRGFELLDESGLLVQILPEIARMKGVEQPPQYHPEGDVWIHTLLLLEHLKKNKQSNGNIAKQSDGNIAASETLAWGMLLHDVGKPATFTPPDPAKPGDRIRFNGHVEVGMAIARTILNRLRFSNEDCAQIIALIQHHMQFADVMKMKQSTLKRFLRLPKFDEHMALHRADVLSSNKNLELYDYAAAKLEELGKEQIRPKLLVTGEDLIAAGYKPGPGFREMLLAAEDAQLEGEVSTKNEALRLIASRFGTKR